MTDLVAARVADHGVAGVYDSTGVHPDETASLVARALGSDGSERVVRLQAESSDSAGCLLVGEIFNLEAIRTLGGEDHRPADPEAVLAAAYERVGERVLGSLRGAFTILLWAPGRPTVLAGDQFGLRPAYLHSDGARLFYASDTSILLKLLPRRPRPDEVSVVHSLVAGQPPQGRSMYEGIQPIGAGEYLPIQPGPIRYRRYWNLRYEPPLRLSFDEAAEGMWNALSQTVAARMNGADIGIIMSGGIDSSAVAAAATEVATGSNPRRRGYSAVFPGHPRPGVDESERITELVDALRLSNVQVEIQPQGLLAVSLEYLERWRLPVTGAGCLIERPLLAIALDDGIGALLDGLGGDECFGTSAFLPSDRLRHGRILASWRLIRRLPGAGAAPRRRVARQWSYYALRGALPYRLHQAQRRRRGPEGLVPPHLRSEAARMYLETDETWIWKRRTDAPRWWAWKSYLLAGGRPPYAELLRQRADLVGMKPRPPLLDVDFVEYLLRIPPDLGWGSELSRPLIRTALSGRVPDSVRLSREKSNLGPFYYQCVAGADLEAIRSILGTDALIGDYVRRDLLDEMLRDPPGVDDPRQLQWLTDIWWAAATECWLRQHEDEHFVDALRDSPISQPATRTHRAT
jgi:asparagine synthase (glutamine-hydrolysing)